MSSPRPSTKASVVSGFRRSQVLAAARASFARYGRSGTTVDRIAAMAGVAKGTVYLYFKSKDEILWQALAEDMARLRKETVPVAAGAEPVRVRLEQFFRAMLAGFDRHRAFIEFCQFEMAPDMRRKAKQHMSQIHRAQTKAWSQALVRAARRNEARAADPASAALAIVSLAHGLALQRVRGWTTDPSKAIVSASDLIAKGLGTR
jgi:AcrR family transcriptional regulator